LLPLTEDRPKCLIDFAGKSLLRWQIEALAAQGVTNVAVVTGFRSELVEAEVASFSEVSARTLFNPFYQVADNLASCWIARAELHGDFIILNGDTLVSPAIVARLLADAVDPITVTVDVKTSYDADDMKVEREGRRLVSIGKLLPPERSNAESIGMLAFNGEGARRFREKVEEMMRTPAGVTNWYLKAIDSLAAEGIVGTASIEGLAWSEVDFPSDLATAEKLVGAWIQAGQNPFTHSSKAGRD
jgi:choline kinase